jgi:hypothetical protein
MHLSVKYKAYIEHYTTYHVNKGREIAFFIQEGIHELWKRVHESHKLAESMSLVLSKTVPRSVTNQNSERKNYTHRLHRCHRHRMINLRE